MRAGTALVLTMTMAACTPAAGGAATTTSATTAPAMSASAPAASGPAASATAEASAVPPLAVGSGAVPASSVGPVPDCARVPGQEQVEVVLPPLDARMMNNATADASVDRSYAELGAVVQRATGALRCCYASARGRRPDLSGRLVVDLELDGDGRVKSVSLPAGKSDINDETMTGCVVATGRELVFPASRRGRPTRVTLPVVFRPREAR